MTPPQNRKGTPFRRFRVPFMAALVLLLLAILAHAYFGISYQTLFRDIHASSDLPAYTGIFSQIGLLGWSVGLGALLLATFHPARRGGMVPYALVLTFLLMADDSFMLHEAAGELFGGVGEKGVFAVYGLILLLYLLRYAHALLQTRYWMLLVGLAGFGASLFADLVPQLSNIIGIEGKFLLEDGAKLFGIVFWTAFQCSVAAYVVQGGQYDEQPLGWRALVARPFIWLRTG